MSTILGSKFTARSSPLAPEGVRSRRNPRILYRSADAPNYPNYDVDTPAGPVAAPRIPAPAGSDKAAADAAGSIGKAIADTIGGLFGKKPPAPSTVAEKRARDATLYVVAGVAIVAVVLVLRAKR